MDYTPHLYMLFHFGVFAVRKHLELLHLAQFVIIFYLQTVDEIVHAYYTWLIYLLHPRGVLRDVRNYIISKSNSEETPRQCPAKNWLLMKALTFCAGLNQVQIQAQQTEVDTRDFLLTIDVKQILESVSSTWKRVLPFLEKPVEDEDEISEIEEPEEGRWFQIHLWGIPRRSVIFARFGGSRGPDDETASMHDIGFPDSAEVPKSGKIEELADPEGSLLTEDSSIKPTTEGPSGPATNVSESYAPSFSELKTLWGDRIRKRKPH